MGRQPYCLSCMEVSYCTFGFSVIIWRGLRTLSLPCDSSRDNQYACAIWVHAGKATHASRNYLAGLATKKSGRYNNSPPYVIARWPPQQIPPLKFLEYNSSIAFHVLWPFCLVCSFWHQARIPVFGCGLFKRKKIVQRYEYVFKQYAAGNVPCCIFLIDKSDN